MLVITRGYLLQATSLSFVASNHLLFCWWVVHIPDAASGVHCFASQILILDSMWQVVCDMFPGVSHVCWCQLAIGFIYAIHDPSKTWHETNIRRTWQKNLTHPTIFIMPFFVFTSTCLFFWFPHPCCLNVVASVASLAGSRWWNKSGFVWTYASKKHQKCMG